MILALSSMLMIFGVVFMIMDMFIPLDFGMAFNFTFKFMGLGFFAMGLMILGGRIYQTGVGAFIDIPNTRRVILLHQRRGKNPNAYFLPARLDDLEYIRCKNKIFKDTGGGFRVAGHDVRRTHEMVCFDVPEWLSQYFYQVKKHFGADGNSEFKQLRKGFKSLVQPVPGAMSIEDQLNKISLLEPIMKDEKAKQYLLNMDISQLQNLEFVLYDGVVHHAEEAEKFIESATPNELSVLEKQKFLNEKMEEKHYREPGEVNWGAFVPYILMFMVVGAITVAIIAGVFG